MRLSVLGVLALAAVIVVSVLTGGSVAGTPCEASNALVGHRVAAFAAPGLSAGTVHAPWSQHHAGVIIFFASWCGPCQREMPEVATYIRSHSLTPIQVVGIDALDARGAAQHFVAHDAVTFPVAFDPNGDVTSGEFKFQTVPETAFVDATGVVRFVYYGAIPTSCLVSDVAALKST